MTEPRPTDQHIAFAAELADAARSVTMRYFRTGVALERKGDDSPVTIADRETESLLSAMIRQRYPGHGVLGEEHGAVASLSGWTWVIDPIDGTKSFATGKPLFGTLIALVHGERPLLGVVDAPALGERWIGAAGRVTTWQGQPCRTAPTASLADATLYATTVDMFSAPEWQRFESLSRAVRFRNFGGDCYAYCMVAAGYVDLVVEAGLDAYDIVPLIPIVEGAGGVVTNWTGESAANGGRIIAAGDKRVHAAALELLNK